MGNLLWLLIFGIIRINDGNNELKLSQTMRQNTEPLLSDQWISEPNVTLYSPRLHAGGRRFRRTNSYSGSEWNLQSPNSRDIRVANNPLRPGSPLPYNLSPKKGFRSLRLLEQGIHSPSHSSSDMLRMATTVSIRSPSPDQEITATMTDIDASDNYNYGIIEKWQLRFAVVCFSIMIIIIIFVGHINQ